jgi:hypothetical protein
MFLSEKHKVDSEGKIFHEKWRDEYFCVSMNGKVLCLIFSDSITVFKDNIVRYYNSKHKEKYRNCVCALRREKVVDLKGGLSHSRMSSKNNPMIVPLHCRKATVLLTRWLKKANFIFNGKFVRKCLQNIVQAICPN